MKLGTLKKIIKRAPKTAGMYIWCDAKEKPLYIGKAANLRSRLSNYKGPTDPRIVAMVKAATKLTWVETDSDIEALILESRFIKKHQPKFNVIFRDDKNYFYVAVTDEKFPQFILTHQYQSSKIRKPIKELTGPFTDGTALKTTLRVLRRLFPYCTCKQKHNLPCLSAHIGKCLGFCCLKALPTSQQKKEYSHNIRAIRDMLTGKRNVLIRRLARTDPDAALKVLRVFQNAQINSKDQKFTELSGVPERIEGYDIANIQGQHAVGAMVVFINGIPEKSEYRLFNIKTSGGDTDMLREMLERRTKHIYPAKGGASWKLPDIVVVDGGRAQLNVVRDIFSKHIRIVALTKDDHHKGAKIIEKKGNQFRERLLAELVAQERDLIIAVDAEAHRFAVSRYRLRHRRSMK